MFSTVTTVFQSSPIRTITTITIVCLLAVSPKASYSFLLSHTHSIRTKNYNTIIISSRSSSCTFHRLRFPFIQRTRNPQQQQKVSSIQSLRGEDHYNHQHSFFLCSQKYHISLSSSALFSTLGPRNYHYSSTRSFTSLLSPFDHHHHQLQTRRQQQQQQIGISLFSSVSDSNNKVNNIMVETKIRRSSRKAVKRKVPATTATTANDDDDEKESVKTKETIENKKSSNESDSDNDSSASTSKPSKKKKVKTTSSPATKKKTKKKKKKVEQQAITKKDPLPKLWDAQKAKTENGSYTFKILSWNVNGIRAVLKKDPDTFVKLVKQYDADMLCLQETKIQEIHVKDLEDSVLPGGGYTSYWSCSTSKKGYAGTVVFVRDRGGERAKADKDENTSTEAEATATATADTKKKKQTSLQSFFGKKPPKKKATKATTTAEKETTKDTSTTTATDTTSDFDFDYSQFIPSTVSYGLGKEKHDTEGRMVTLDFPLFSITNVYTPNSSEKLVRIDYRTQEWDEDFVKFHYDKWKNNDNDDKDKNNNKSRGVIWLGDLNVAHGKMDMWNYGAKHLEKTPGCTERERISFQEQLDYKSNDVDDEDKDSDQVEEEDEEPKCTPGSTFIDAFRHFHPDKWGHYSWWSVRAGNRPVNKGLRLDYFICSKNMFEEDQKVTVRDSYILPDQMGSDHCPIVLELEVKK